MLPITTHLNPPHAQLRAELAGTHLIDLALGRYGIAIEPLASTNIDTISSEFAHDGWRELAGRIHGLQCQSDAWQAQAQALGEVVSADSASPASSMMSAPCREDPRAASVKATPWQGNDRPASNQAEMPAAG